MSRYSVIIGCFLSLLALSSVEGAQHHSNTTNNKFDQQEERQLINFDALNELQTVDSTDGTKTAAAGPGRNAPGPTDWADGNFPPYGGAMSMPPVMTPTYKPVTPTYKPVMPPTHKPVMMPHYVPTEKPVAAPYYTPPPPPYYPIVPMPIRQPTPPPTRRPTPKPTPKPVATEMPSETPSALPTQTPTISSAPTPAPSAAPTPAPSSTPTISLLPSAQPTLSSEPSLEPSVSAEPSDEPSISLEPSAQPSLSSEPSLSVEPSASPSVSNEPTPVSEEPSASPTSSPSSTPTTSAPTSEPSGAPTMAPSISNAPSPVFQPTSEAFGGLSVRLFGITALTPLELQTSWLESTTMFFEREIDATSAGVSDVQVDITLGSQTPEDNSVLITFDLLLSYFIDHTAITADALLVEPLFSGDGRRTYQQVLINTAADNLSLVTGTSALLTGGVLAEPTTEMPSAQPSPEPMEGAEQEEGQPEEGSAAEEPLTLRVEPAPSSPALSVSSTTLGPSSSPTQEQEDDSGKSDKKKKTRRRLRTTHEASKTKIGRRRA